ncbi:anaerobic ribonucleoside-triphosphate reductase activating protein [Geodermatophilus bullaregiensis]|uniref:4Fe-4S single cluster domain-containing protein n=1 Tax=Geodermatophilus bullaregiensis TaxID=1564160 RepID=UPI001957D443|nr:4Fe-4S single cluster domain-containing protein [Geodermatophilus bullaregiensis]MBM7808313.1 anaerobic ribonucleoside-triphosphate reductase activating protein [Geodermatophilus bullaregiensis]
MPEGVVGVARLVPVTQAEGPGRRTALWVQGCSIRCPGCFNPQMWTRRGGVKRNVDELASEIIAGATAGDVEGVTILGGEPFEQAAPLARLAALVQAAGLSVMTFTGYELPVLRTWAVGRSDIATLLRSTDLLADGPFLQDRLDVSRPWIGSTNQGLHALTKRYADRLSALNQEADRLEIRVNRDGLVAVNGWADTETLDRLLAGVGRRGDGPRRS